VAKALIVVDVQNDFCPGGTLAVPEGDAVVDVLNAYARDFVAAGAIVVATRDWHPTDTRHFQQFGGIWPVHCVQDTPGAAFHPNLTLPEGTLVLSKGAHPEADGYSGFEARTAEGVSLLEILQKRGVSDVYVGGLATDYCVKATVLDARKNGFRAVLLRNAVRGVNLQPWDSEQAIAAMVQAGADVSDG